MSLMNIKGNRGKWYLKIGPQAGGENLPGNLDEMLIKIQTFK